MKLVTYSEPNTPATLRSGLVWGDWILNIGDLPKLADQLDIKVPRGVRSISRRNPSIPDLLGKGSRILDDLQNLSWRFFNRTKPEKVPKILRRVVDVRVHAPIPRPPNLRDFYAFEDHVIDPL